MSPTMTTLRLANPPLLRRMANMSSMAWVGCECWPSPALITLICGSTWLAIKCAAPEAECLTTNISHCIACRLRNVSSSVSPLLTAETLTFIFSTSAESLFAASSNVVRVRVLSSKKRLATVLPRNKGTFLATLSFTPAKVSAVSRISTRRSRASPSTVRKCLSSPVSVS